jgi:hypothetical protein
VAGMPRSHPVFHAMVPARLGRVRLHENQHWFPGCPGPAPGFSRNCAAPGFVSRLREKGSSRGK